MDLAMDKVQYEKELLLLLKRWQNAREILGPNLSEAGSRNVMELLKETSVILVSFFLFKYLPTTDDLKCSWLYVYIDNSALLKNPLETNILFEEDKKPNHSL